MTLTRKAHKCDLIAHAVPGYSHNHQCPGVAVLIAVLPDGDLRYVCIGHGRQLRFHGLEGMEIELKLMDPFPTLQDALDVIVGEPPSFISLCCREDAHDGCLLFYGVKVCTCECSHEMAGSEFTEE